MSVVLPVIATLYFFGSIVFVYFLAHALGYNKGFDSGYEQRLHEERRRDDVDNSRTVAR